MSRLHNNSNVLALGSRMSGCEDPDKILDVWLNNSKLDGIELLNGYQKSKPNAECSDLIASS